MKRLLSKNHLLGTRRRTQGLANATIVWENQAVPPSIIATTLQVADFYEVPAANIRKGVERHRAEVESDGLQVLSSKALKQVSDSKSLTSTAPKITVHTPRSTLRLGMTMENSPIAKAVRTSLLDAVEAIPAAVEKVRELELQLAIAQAQREAAASHAETAIVKNG